MWPELPEPALLGVLLGLTQALGFVSAARAIMEARTAQGATAWAVALISFPYFAIPLFLIFGQSKFHGYVTARRADLVKSGGAKNATYANLAEDGLLVETRHTKELPFEKLTKLPFTTANDAQLLIDGEATFASIFAGIDAARDYVLVQFYILRDDNIGRALQQHLLQRSRAGVRIYVLYDEIGSHETSRAYFKELRDGGVAVSPFHALGPQVNRFRLNFRNHRKIVVVDGYAAWVGGLNVGDEYLSRNRKIGYWRDTHIRVEGPAAQCAQVAFVEDWHWAAGEFLDLTWTPRPAGNGAKRAILCLPSGPADELETCDLFFVAAITQAKSRVWIASPYWVPDEQVITALQLAALRGVDIRILMPEHSDNPLVQLTGWSYLDDVQKVGIAVYRFLPGLTHQKVILIDDDFCTVGSVNVDNRSFRLNFEITMAAADRAFAKEVEAMLQNDFSRARRMEPGELRTRPLSFRFAVRAARLLAPVQ